ncbi:hypothetical protein CP967_25510 [Streptomyces nitrosporeus]|uniref:N-acetylglutamate synthase n=1 Tax=Streptomyces nitrosporeus TaxID=28894 RepID=A0A5J6FEN5_9ACTN|nr:hypothetical protein [Streptomyces nitrosporeus]QEU74898.1 hypothetical protein CP967_25510 [Streptomyces nitrosporeus]GGY92676.1 hypothetical protein GCM10010327_24400 [Streptomyces nitrosporeus]
MARSLDGLVLSPVADQAPGQVGTRTRFTYHERDGRIWAEYAGGDVVRGHLVGTREADTLDFRYVQLKQDGTTSSGHCRSTVTELADGRVRLDERWAWESQEGSGTSVVEELPA